MQGIELLASEYQFLPPTFISFLLAGSPFKCIIEAMKEIGNVKYYLFMLVNGVKSMLSFKILFIFSINLLQMYFLPIKYFTRSTAVWKSLDLQSMVKGFFCSHFILFYLYVQLISVFILISGSLAYDEFLTILQCLKVTYLQNPLQVN